MKGARGSAGELRFGRWIVLVASLAASVECKREPPPEPEPHHVRHRAPPPTSQAAPHNKAPAPSGHRSGG